MGQQGRIRFPQIIPNRWARWGVYLAFWTILGLLNAGSAITDAQQKEPGISAWEPLLWEMSSLYTIGILCPLVVSLTLQLRSRVSAWAPRLLLHLPAMAAFSLIHSAGMVAIRKAVYWTAGGYYDFGGGRLGTQLLYEFYKDTRTYWIIVLLTLGFEYYNKYRERELETLQLETRLVEAQLENLKGQLNPHFLFNTLNMISAYMHEDVDAADRMISRLSDLLRLNLHNSGRHEVALGEELETLGLYVEIMRARFQEKLQLETRIDPASRRAQVPNLVLQPLVENAVRHAVAGRSRGGRIEVESLLVEGRLQLTVRDDGPGIRVPPGALLGRGHGLSNTAERLERLYGDDHRFDICNAPDGGLEVQIVIPFRPAKDEAPVQRAS